MGTKGTCLYGKLNYHLGKAKAQRDGEAMFPNVDFCNDPGQICAGLDSIPLRWISGMYHWMENVQKYDKSGYNYKNELVRYVNGGLTNTEFFDGAVKIHVLGCHKTDCSSLGSPTDMDARLRAFEMVMSLFGLQFESHAEPEPPFRAFPGQQVPTQAPTVVPPEEAENTTSSPISSPEGNQTVVIQFNVFLTGVPNATNMTNEEQILFESIMFDMLALRLGTVDIKVLDVVTDSQIPNPFVAESSFDSQSESGARNEGGGSVEETKPVLQVVMNVTIGYTPPPPEGARDWSIYVKSWVESFGDTLVEIFTSPKHPQHPETNSIFWDDLIDVSATNVEPRNTDPAQAPTPAVWVYPDTSKNKYIIAGVTLAILFFCAFFLTKFRRYRRRQSSLQHKKKVYLEVVDEESHQRQIQKKSSAISASDRSPDKAFSYPRLRGPLQRVVEESSSDSSSSSDSESSSDSDGGQKKALSLAVRKVAGGGKSQSVSTGMSGEEIASAAARSWRSVAYASSFSKRSSRVSVASASSYGKGSTRGSVASASSNGKGSTRGLVASVSSNGKGSTRGLVASASSNGKGSTRGSVASASSNGIGSTRGSVASAFSYSKGSTRDSVASASSSAKVSTRDSVASASSSAKGSTRDSVACVSSYPKGIKAIEDSGQWDKGNQKEITEDMKLSRFDEIVERVMVNDPTLNDIVLDEWKRVKGHRHRSHTLWNALCGNTFVTRLSLRCCNINDQEAASLSLALVDNTCITHVWLGDNDITDEGVECEKHSFILQSFLLFTLLLLSHTQFYLNSFIHRLNCRIRKQPNHRLFRADGQSRYRSCPSR